MTKGNNSSDGGALPDALQNTQRGGTSIMGSTSDQEQQLQRKSSISFLRTFLGRAVFKGAASSRSKEDIEQ